MILKIWGARGSIVAPGLENKYYGGNTSCLELFSSSHDYNIIIDSGTGIIPLGKKMVNAVSRHTVVDYRVLLSHTHIDHIQGFVFFEPIYHENSYISLYCPSGTQKSLSQIIGNLFQEHHSPLKSINNLKSSMDFIELDLNPFTMGPYQIEPILLDHPIPTYAYRITDGDVDITYCTDHEARDNAINKNLIEKLKGTQVLIHDSQYLDDEYKSKEGWGHSSIGRVIENAMQIEPQLLILFHHSPEHTDKILDRKLEYVQKKLGSRMKIFCAREGMQIKLNSK